jgi:hypothetical protein
MSETLDGPTDSLRSDLVDRVIAVVEDALLRDRDAMERDIGEIEALASTLIERKHQMLGSKRETAQLVTDVLFRRVRSGLRAMLDSPSQADEVRVAERVLGGLLTSAAIGDLAIAIDRSILGSSAPLDADYSFAGRSDFISVEEVVQLLGGGKHQGCLSLEKDDNRLDVYLRNGSVAFLDPHRMSRRVLPGTGQNYREIPASVLDDAEQLHAKQSIPIFVTLAERGYFKDLETRTAMRQLGSEILHEFLRDQDRTRFFYRRLDQLPSFVAEYDLRFGVTPILLECSKRLDDWRSMVNVFPDPDQPLQPVDDMFARIASLDLGVLEIKMLAQINGETTPRSLVSAMGLPLHDVYQYLVRFAREGVLIPPGGLQALHDLSMSVEESMRMAFEALDANDDDAQIGSVLDRVLGGDSDDFGGSTSRNRGRGAASGSDKFNLDFLRAARDDES